MLFLKYVFNLLKDEKERSAEREVTCITAKIFRTLVTFSMHQLNEADIEDF